MDLDCAQLSNAMLVHPYLLTDGRQLMDEVISVYVTKAYNGKMHLRLISTRSYRESATKREL